jgi:hypothetical protein
MRRFLLAALPLVLFVGAACGDDDGDGDGGEQADGETPTLSPADAVATSDASNQQPQAPDKPLPSPTPVPDGSPLLQVVVAGNPYTPTRAEFADLPKTSIDAGGNKYEGVTLAALAEQAGAAAESVVTIQGTRSDNLRFGAIRFPLAEIGASTVLVMDESGHLLLASTSVPQDQWLKDITGIAMN